MLVLSSEPDLLSAAKRIGADDPRFLVTGDSLHCDGTGAPLTNIYPVEPVLAEWDGWEAPATDMPDPRTMSQLIFECRSPEWVAEVGGLLAEGIAAPVWFLDAAGVPWSAGEVDPSRVVLA